MNPIDTVKSLRIDDGQTLNLEKNQAILSTENRVFETELLLDIKDKDDIKLSLLTQDKTELITLGFSLIIIY